MPTFLQQSIVNTNTIVMQVSYNLLSVGNIHPFCFYANLFKLI